MKVGLFVTNQQHLDRDMVSALEDQYAMVRLARDSGWDALFSGQHYLNEGDNKQLQLVPMLARLSAEAGEMTCGLGVLLLNLHNPVYVAETIASLDVICKGNFVFGIGLGYRDVEFDAFGVPKGQRVRRFEDGLALVKRLWTEDAVSFESDYCRLDKVRLNIRPVQQPHPPIWIAANSDPAVRRAARLGDAWLINPHATAETVARQTAVYKAELARQGRPVPRVFPCLKEIFCAMDRKTAIAMAGPYLAGKYRDYAKWGQDKVMPGRDNFEAPFEALLRDRFVLGSPEECYEQLRPNWETLGVTMFIFRTQWAGMPVSTAMHSMRLMAAELLPALHAV
ncbi:MAG: LLM class flavin-dependent oxidoreductase [Candidatus Lambdaproteobacteria bacterium]|nr:LLM class flavin-dependent oxidoreductase [Candidatus Lambdaproteobacteria bacterium]